ncbi:hypothetical protein GCM10022206_23700 [Streptomyces chiangmaiensis]
MQHTLITVGPATRRGLGAVVLLALMALLHASFSPGASHLSVLGPDGCRRQTAEAGVSGCPVGPPAVVRVSAGEDHRGGGIYPSCGASGSEQRRHTFCFAVHLAPSAMREPVCPLPHPVSLSTRDTLRLAAASTSVVLRC